MKRIVSLLLVLVMVVLSLPPTGNLIVSASTEYENAWFPAPIMNLSQIAHESYSHGDQNAIDILPGGTVFAPFTGTIVYTDPNWGYVVLQSDNKVCWADGSCDYMSVGFMHDESIKDLYVGKKIKQGELFYHAGGMGNGNPDAYGDHVHLTVHRGKVTRGYPYGNGDEYAFNAFFVNKQMTTGTAGRGEGYVASGGSVSNGSPTDYRGLWVTLPTSNLIKESYSTYCTIEVTDTTTNVKSLPCSVETNADSETIETAKKGDTYIAIGLYRNTPGNLWYKVQAKSGGTGYIYAGDTQFIAHKTDDMEVTGVSAPTELTVGSRFWIEGVIQSQYNVLTSVGAVVYKETISGDTYQQETLTGTILDVDTYKYDLYKSDVDDQVEFNILPAGEYNYIIVASTKAYYATSGTEYATVDANKILYGSTFLVKTSTSCSHSYAGKITTAATCTTNGVKTYTCSNCGASYSEILLANGEHTFGDWTTKTAAGCTTKGLQERACTACGDKQTQELAATDHAYQEKVISATCVEHEKIRYTCSKCQDTYEMYPTDGYSSWSTEKPSGVADSLIESRTEYRYRTKEYTNSTSSSLSGWTMYDSSQQWTTYGSWSTWSDSAVTANDATKVESRRVYGYYYYLCPSCGAHMHGYGTCWTWAGGCGAKTTSSNWVAVWSTTTWDDAGLKDWHGTGKYYTYIDGQLVFKWNDGGSKLQYRYCTREQQTVYNYYKWSDWSNWSIEVTEETAEREVETRIVYRYVNSQLGTHKYTEIVTAPTCTAQGYTTYTCTVCGYSYKDSYVSATGHSYTYKVTTNPTTSATGVLTGTCSKCSGTTTVTLPKLNTTDYTYSVKTAATCTGAGVGTYTWKTTTYGSFKFDVSIAAKGHTYTSKVTAPTCTAQGYTTYTCTCGHSYKDSYTNALGHSYDYKVTTAPTTSATGVLTGTCSKCSGTTTVTLPKLNTTDYTYSVKTAATCTAAGTGQYTWKTTTYGTYKFDVTIPATGHSYTSKVTAPTCTAQGCTTYTCTCGHSYKDSYTNALGHSYSYKVTTNPTTSATGVLTGTCSKCSGTTTVTLPKLNTTDYTYSVTKEPSYTATGVGTYTWKTTTYGTFKFDVSIEKLIATLSKIEVATIPNKTSYSVGESLDTTGLTLKLAYSDSTSKTVTNGFTVSGFDSSSAGTKTVTVTYEGKTATFTVTVTEPEPEIDENAPQIVVSSGSGILGQQVQVAVSLKNNPGITSMLITVVYDTDVLQLVSVEDCEKLGIAFHSDNLASPYTLSWANDTATSNYVVDGDIVVLTFNVLDTAALGETAINISYDYDNYDIIDKDMNPIRFTTLSGNYTIRDVLVGDVNGDGKVNTLDRVVLTRYIAKWAGYTANDICIEAADVNGDGKVNTLDRVILTRYIAKWNGYTELPYAG